MFKRYHAGAKGKFSKVALCMITCKNDVKLHKVCTNARFACHSFDRDVTREASPWMKRTLEGAGQEERSCVYITSNQESTCTRLGA